MFLFHRVRPRVCHHNRAIQNRDPRAEGAEFAAIEKGPAVVAVFGEFRAAGEKLAAIGPCPDSRLRGVLGSDAGSYFGCGWDGHERSIDRLGRGVKS